ncbi:hypothetical protein RND71_023047 [Anisodus tanguticus]|uniref:Uncharacterized protein n=1 Tax=Anisodus tanguticus TaxID=243964 RepID=A0AAE1RUT1_9SOLA|nr:hypothetical protein RND71_023047 [Anisodus tanguticus]
MQKDKAKEDNTKSNIRNTETPKTTNLMEVEVFGSQEGWTTVTKGNGKNRGKSNFQNNNNINNGGNKEQKKGAQQIKVTTTQTKGNNIKGTSENNNKNKDNKREGQSIFNSLLLRVVRIKGKKLKRHRRSGSFVEKTPPPFENQKNQEMDTKSLEVLNRVGEKGTIINVISPIRAVEAFNVEMGEAADMGRPPDPIDDSTSTILRSGKAINKMESNTKRNAILLVNDGGDDEYSHTSFNGSLDTYLDSKDEELNMLSLTEIEEEINMPDQGKEDDELNRSDQGSDQKEYEDQGEKMMKME